ncbi:hypothetical protein [Metasolibacillus meyeri]|nr:hypothetical protein [Metasolibacillus meyeri]
MSFSVRELNAYAGVVVKTIVTTELGEKIAQYEATGEQAYLFDYNETVIL